MTKEELETIKWLNRAFHKDKKINALRSLLERDRARAQKMTANYDSNGKGRSDSRQNDVEDALLLCAQTEEKYNRAMLEYKVIRKEIEDAIESLNDDELEALLTYRYLDGLSMENIAEKMGYSVRAVKYKHKNSLKNFAPFCIVLHGDSVI